MYRNRLQCSLLLTALALGAIAVAPIREVSAVEFLRGDVNNDGTISIADSVFLTNFLFRHDRENVREPSCRDAANANGDDELNLSDAVLVFRATVFGESGISAPFPEPGDAEPQLGCSLWDGSSVVEDDPGTTFTVRDAIVAGGPSANGFLRFAIANAEPISSFQGRIIDEAGILDPNGLDSAADPTIVTDLSGLIGLGFLGLQAKEDVLTFAALVNVVGSHGLPASESRDVIEVPFCVRPGTPAGDYPLTLEVGQVTDYLTGRTGIPVLVSGTIRVAEDVTATECTPDRRTDVEFHLSDAAGKPGEVVSTRLSILSNRGFQGAQLSLTFDERYVEVISVESIPPAPRPEGYDVGIYDVHSATAPETTGQLGAYYVATSRFRDNFAFPPDTELDFLEISLRIAENAPVGQTELRFTSGAPMVPRPNEHGCTVLTRSGHCESFETYRNFLVSGSARVTPEVADSFVFVDAVLRVVADVGFFRGDVNNDNVIDLSDGVFTLNHLFLGSDPLPCPDAADSDDTGSIDITDAVFLLNHLFLGGTPPPPPFLEKDRDPTPDALPPCDWEE